ncbi:MAG: SDR family oxidoreductase [Acidimicrobiales bacterium]
MRSVAELMRLDGRVALVTGAAGHIGRTACETLAELGGTVAAADIDGSGCEKLAEALVRDFDADASALTVDLGDEPAVRALPFRVLAEHGRLDILVHCAALVGAPEALPGWSVDFADQRVDTWRRALEVNLTSVFSLTQASAAALAANGRGVVVNVSSIYGLVGPDLGLYEGTDLGNPAAYAVSKGGLLQLTRWLATVLAPDVRVNAISPGGVERGQPEEFQERYLRRTPLGRMATEEDLRGAIAYLATDLSSYVTGHNLVVDGGWTVW